MFTVNAIVLYASALVAVSSTASAFFLNWGATQETSPAYPQYYYHQRLLQAPTTYTVPGTEPPVPVSIPSIPIQLPLKAQLSPASNVHNVQLVPCLCPVSQDLDFEKLPHENSGGYFAPGPAQPQKTS